MMGNGGVRLSVSALSVPLKFYRSCGKWERGDVAAINRRIYRTSAEKSQE